MARIAVVEDNRDNQLVVRAILEDAYELDMYDNGRAALQGIAAKPPALILLDISLPEMDGTEVLRLLRERPELRPIPAVALTAHAMSSDEKRFLAAGFNGYITKPIIDETQLLTVIQKLLPAEGSGG